MKWFCYPSLVLLVLSGVVADASTFRESDPRLGKKVILDVNHIKLDDVVRSLAEQSGVDIKAGTGSRDWKVRERRVTIHAKDIQLDRMLDEIVRLTGYRLSREGKEGAWSYVVWQDLKARQLEEEMVIASKDAEAKRAMDIRQDTLNAAEDALKMTAEESLKKRDKDPLAAYLGGTRSGRGFAQLLSSLQGSFPTEYELMMRGKKVTIPVSSIPPGLAGAVADIMAGKLSSAMSGGGLPPDAQGPAAPYELVIEGTNGPGSDIQGIMGLGGVVTLNASIPGQQGVAFPAGMFLLTSSDSKVGNMFGKFLLALEDGLDIAKADEQIRAEAGMTNLFARKSSTEEDPPTDLSLLREIEIKEAMGAIQPGMQRTNLSEEQGKMMGEVARAAGISVLLESYDSVIPVSAFIKKGKQPFYHILVAAEKAGCTWDLGKGTLRIRPQDWAIYRSQEIAESFLNHYKSLIEKNSHLTMDDLAAMAAGLTDAQVEGGLRRDKDLGDIVGAVIDDKGRRDVLRAYGLMNADQKSVLTSADGLPFAQLTDQQWKYLEEIITDRLGGIQIIDGSIRIVPREDETKRPDTEILEIKVCSPNEKPRLVKTWVNIPTKAFIKQIQEQRKQIQEMMDKAAKDREAAKNQEKAKDTKAK